ncbi:MAG: PQQ-binding-like beta-propeller repeat protein [Polyangiaceae bacterium]
MRGIRFACLGALVACGAKTALLPGSGGGATGSGGSSGGAGPTGPLAVLCTSAMLDGAPTPTRAYCPTRAGQAPFRGPRGPRVAWSKKPFTIDDAESFFPAQTVVDPTGRAYVMVDASPINQQGGPNRLTAVESDGTIAWTRSFPQPQSGLTLGKDGTLWLTGPDLIGLSADGTTVVDVPIGAPADGGFGLTPAPYGDLAIGADGTLYLASGYAFDNAGAIERITRSGAVLWQYSWSNADPLVSAFLLTPADAVIDVSGGNLSKLDPAGNVAWQSFVSGGVSACDSTGDVYVLEGTGRANPSLQVVDGAGATVRSVSLGLPQMTVDASQLAVAGDGTAVVLVADEITSPGQTKSHVVVMAVDTALGPRWTTAFDVTLPFDPAELSAHYGVFVDAAGTVVVTAGHVAGLDLSSGSIVWTLDAPEPQSCLRPAVLGAGGSIVATQCDGTVFLGRDP